MKVTRTPAGTPYANAVSRPAGSERAARARATDETRRQADPDVSDTIQILGIPPEEFTPKVQAAISTLMAEVEDLRAGLANANARLRDLEELADLDTLIPVPNRRAFIRELNRMIRFAERYGTPSTLVFIDMNDLKLINDRYGHDAGDAALKHLARTLKDNLRGTDTLARLGGDEFGILLAQTDKESGIRKADELAETVRDAPLSLGDQQITLQFAYGTYTFGGDTEAETVLSRADAAMYEHKKEMKGADDIR